MASAYYWTAREPAVEWFTAVPFGMDAEGMAAWYYQGDGLKLWEETYAAFNLVPRPATAVSPQMAGWFRKKTNTIGDYKGLKMRIGTGQGGKVYVKAGGTAVLTPAAEIYAELERGVIDAAEWIGPHDDMKLGLHKTARYYYYPGWHEPGNTTEFGFNKKAYEALPVDTRTTQGGVPGQGRGAPASGAGAARSQEAVGRGRQGGIREDSHGPEGPRVLHEVPGAGGSLGPRRRGRLPSVRRGMRRAA